MREYHPVLCGGCGEPEAQHYVLPRLGEPGHFVCSMKCQQCGESYEPVPLHMGYCSRSCLAESLGE